MRKMFIALMITAASLTAIDVEAKRRLGGGKSTGTQSTNVQKSAPPADATKAATPAAPAAAAPAAAPAAAVPPKPASPWKGMLGGALLGLGLGALLSSMGIGGALANLISIALMVGLFALAAYFIYRLLTKKSGNAPQPAYAGAGSSPEPVSSTMERSASPAPASTPSSTRFRVPEIGSAIGSGAAVAATPVSTWSVPADFDSAGFLRSAKTYFVRLQAAWDKADIADLREFTTPEMFAELKVQLQERDPSPNLTDVVTLEAELLGIENIGRQDVASVKFTGTIREEANGPAEAFAEVWNIAKPAGAKDGWMLAGIQQIS